MNQEDRITPSAEQAIPIASRQKREMSDFPPIGGIEGMVPPRPILHQVIYNDKDGISKMNKKHSITKL